MKRILKILAAVVLLSAAVLPIVATAATEDFTTWTEYDPGGKLTVTADRVSWTNVGESTKCAVYKQIDTVVTDANYLHVECVMKNDVYYDIPDHWEQYYILGLSEDYAYAGDWTTSGQLWASCRYYSETQSRIEVAYNHHVSGLTNLIGWIEFDRSTEYILTMDVIPNVGPYGRFEVAIYDIDDTSLTTPLDMISGNYPSYAPTYNYISVGRGPDRGTKPATQTGYIRALEYTAVQAPVIVTGTSVNVTYSTPYFYADVTANLTAGGTGTTVYMMWTTDNITWNMAGALDVDEDGVYHGIISMSSYYRGTTIYYYAGALNLEGSNSGDVESFVLERTVPDVPSVHTVGVTDISANGTTLWGTVYDDGGANTTGRFQYKVVGADNWTDTANVTGLASNHGFSAVLPAVPDGVYMMFRAAAQNEHGIDYGEIEYFIWQDVGAMPTVTTGAPLNIDYDSATLTGGIEDDGGGYCVVGFDFKRDDETEWTRFEIGGEYSTGDNFTYTLPGGLAELTTYHFRALAANAAGYNEIGDYYTYALGDIVQFTTTQRTGMPVVTLLSVAWHDNYTARGTFRIEDDGGVVCHGNLRYRIPYGAWQYDDSVPNIEGLSTGDTATTYVRGLTYGAEYEFQAWVINDMSGGFGYSNILRYQLVAGDDTTTPPAGDAAAGISNQLTTWGLNNTGGRLLVVVGSMVLVFLLVVLLPGHRYQEYVRYTVPVAGCIDAVLLIFWMSVGYVPVLLTAGILVAAAGTIAMFVVRMFRGRGAPAGD